MWICINGYPEASQVACLGQSVRFSSQTEKKKLALSRGRTGWIQLEGVVWGERAESREERRASGEKRGIFLKSNLWMRG